MITIPGNVRVWLATVHTDMRRGFRSLALLVQETLKRNPHAGDLYVFRGRRSDLIKIIWHDGQGACLFTKRLEFEPGVEAIMKASDVMTRKVVSIAPDA